MTKNLVVRFLESDLGALLPPGLKYTFDTTCDGLKHTRYGCRTVEWHRNPGIKAQMNKVLISGLLTDPTVCKGCLENIYDYSFEQAIASSSVLLDIFKWRTSIANSKKINKKTSVSAIEGRIRDNKHRLQKIEEYLTLHNSDKELLVILEKMEAECKDALEKLQESAASDDAAKALALTVKNFLIPAQHRDYVHDPDDTMVLIGIHPTPNTNWGGAKDNTIANIMRVFSLRSDTSTVLYAPAYFYAYLLGVLFFAKRSNSLVVSATAPETAEAREIAAGLWNPEESTSALAGLSEAVITGTVMTE